MPKKILLADDSITIQKVVELTFSEGDYQVFTVGNGSLALRKIHEVGPDIALLDVIMPEANGYEVCEKVKNDPRTSRIPVLLLTGTFEPFDRNRAEAVGADGHLTKPFESQVLISRVEELIAASPAAVAGRKEVSPEKEARATSHSVPETDGDSAAEPAPTPEEDGIRRQIIPDRYDDYLSEEEPSAPREAGAEGPRAGSSPDPVAETWDELAIGLAAAPGGARMGEAERAEATPAVVPPLPMDPARPVEKQASEFCPPGGGASPKLGGPTLTAEQVERIASRVLEQLSDRVVREIAWEVIPEIAENLIRQRIRELEEKITREG